MEQYSHGYINQLWGHDPKADATVSFLKTQDSQVRLQCKNYFC